MFTFDEERHEYRTVGDRRVIPHITGLLDDYNLTGYADIPSYILEPAKILGSVVHRVTELHDKRILNYATVRSEVMPYFEAWLKFVAESGFQMEHIEPRLYSKAYGFAGTPDRLGTINGIRVVVEIKTIKDWHRAIGIQTAAQRILARECLGFRAQRRYGVQLRDDGTYKVYECKCSLDEASFLATLTLNNWRRNGAIKD